MKANIFLAAAIAQLVASSPAPVPQDFDFGAILDAPAPDDVGPPQSAVASTSSYSVDSAALSASVAADVNSVATASVTGSAASLAASSTQTATPTVDPNLEKRSPGPDCTTTSSSTIKPTTSSTTSTISATSSTAQPTTSSTTTSTTTIQQTTSSTTSSSSSCPTTPEAGTYCGFINPEDPCAPQPDGYGPAVHNPDTPAAFEAYPQFHHQAQQAITPWGYVNTFRDLNGSTNANSYITYKDLTSYNVSDCAAFCDNTSPCTAFNIFAERDPSLNPTTNATNNATNCPNPPSITNYKCSLWGSNIDASTATNYGQWRDQFQVVIAGSNGYDKTNSTTPPSCPGWNPPRNCSGGAIGSGGSYWLGSNFYPGPFDPNVCALYAQAQTNFNRQAAQARGAHSYVPCNMFNAYMVHKNGIPLGTYCSLFDTALNPSWANFLGGWLRGDFFGVRNSWTYELSVPDNGKC